MATFTAFEKRLLNDFQRDFPLTSRPYAELAERLGTDESTVIDTLQALIRGVLRHDGLGQPRQQAQHGPR